MSARQDDNFRQMLRNLDVRRATPRVVVITAKDVRHVELVAERRRQGLRSKIRDAGVVGRIAGMVSRQAAK